LFDNSAYLVLIRWSALIPELPVKSLVFFKQ